jgi:hypothetical protein
MVYTAHCIYTKTGYLYLVSMWAKDRLAVLEKINNLNRISNGVWVYFLPYED